MTRIAPTPEFTQDVRRLREFLGAKNQEAAKRVSAVIRQSVTSLKTYPEAHRPVPSEPNYRELIIPFGATGYKVLYHYRKSADLVTLVAMKHQLENDYQ
jgi:plasmid stabilization system protein ParE